jgi:hypothetical protein
MEYLCLDIKYVWVEGEKRNYYLLSIQDVYSRMILKQILKSSIRKYDVIDLFRSIDLKYGIKGVKIRKNLPTSLPPRKTHTLKPFTASCKEKSSQGMNLTASTRPKPLFSDI